MFFTPVIEQLGGPHELGAALGLPAKNVRRWIDLDTIPVDRFREVERAAKRKGVTGVTVQRLVSLAEERRAAVARRLPKAG